MHDSFIITEASLLSHIFQSNIFYFFQVFSSLLKGEFSKTTLIILYEEILKSCIHETNLKESITYSFSQCAIHNEIRQQSPDAPTHTHNNFMKGNFIFHKCAVYKNS